MKVKGLVLAVVGILLATFLAGCSNNDSGGGAQPVSNMISGKVSDGPIHGATVFIDSNNNGEHDSSEIFTVTDYDGSYVLLLDERDFDMPLTIVAIGGQNVITQKTVNEKFRTVLTSLENANEVYLTPLSDLVALHYAQRNTIAANDSTVRSVDTPTLAEIVEIIANALELDADKILTDPMDDYQVFQAALKVQALIGLLVGASANSDVEEIKNVLVQTLQDSGSLDGATVIANVEAALNIPYSYSVKAFLVNEIDYLYVSIASLDSASNLKYMRYILGDIITKSQARLSTNELDSIVKAQKVYLALSGGGWHSHTTHVGWVMGALEGMEDDGKSPTLEALTEHVDAISSNSGGAWFLSMLAFSDKFKAQVETYTADEYISTGWLGEQEEIFNEDYINWSDRRTDTSKILEDWVDSMRNTVFKPLDLYETLNTKTLLEAPHLSWAEDKALVFATSLGTGRDLSGTGNMKEAGVILNLSNEYMYDSNGSNVYPQVGATPVLLTSLGDSDQKRSPSFTAGDFTLTYTDGDSEITKTYNDDIETGYLSLFAAATSSSAAFGYAATDVSSLGNWVAGAGPGSAILMETNNGAINAAAAEIQYETGTSLAHADAGYMRFFDGGYVDNTSVAYMMKHLQESGLDNNFKIVLFMNDNGSKSQDCENQDYPVDISVAKLFREWKFTEEYQTTRVLADTLAWAFGLNPRVMSPDIFDSASWDSIQEIYADSRDVPIGDGSDQKEITLQYRVYNVTTKENTTLGIKAGSTGELHVFTNFMPDATAMPGEPGGPNIETSFEMYDAMLKTVRKNFRGDEWEHLKSALNLIQ